MLGCRVNTAIDLVESRFVRLDVRTDYLCQSEVNLWYIWFSFYGKMQYKQQTNVYSSRRGCSSEKKASKNSLNEKKSDSLSKLKRHLDKFIREKSKKYHFPKYLVNRHKIGTILSNDLMLRPRCT